MVNDGDLCCLGDDFNYPINVPRNVSCRFTLVLAIDNEMKRVIFLLHNSDSVASLSETTETRTAVMNFKVYTMYII